MIGGPTDLAICGAGARIRMNEKRTYVDMLPEITRNIVSVSDSVRIVLFGSHARGDPDPDSDLDLLIVFDEVGSTRRRSTELRRSLRGLLVPVDILVATPEQLERHRHTVGLIYRTILAEGKVVYERPSPVKRHGSLVAACPV